MDKQLFELGSIVSTPGALRLDVNLFEYLQRHATGDWGDVSDEDAKENEYSVSRQLRILSAYETPHGRLWIITEADRSATTFLLPSEY